MMPNVTKFMRNCIAFLVKNASSVVSHNISHIDKQSTKVVSIWKIFKNTVVSHHKYCIRKHFKSLKQFLQTIIRWKSACFPKMIYSGVQRSESTSENYLFAIRFSF